MFMRWGGPSCAQYFVYSLISWRIKKGAKKKQTENKTLETHGTITQPAYLKFTPMYFKFIEIEGIETKRFPSRQSFENIQTNNHVFDLPHSSLLAGCSFEGCLPSVVQQAGPCHDDASYINKEVIFKGHFNAHQLLLLKFGQSSCTCPMPL